MKNAKINAQKLTEGQMECVIGGIAKMFIFLTAHIDGKYYYTRTPIKVGIGSDPSDYINDNIGFFSNAANKDLISTSNSYPSSEFQSFANEYASHWKDPTTWGNLVYSVDVTDRSVHRYEA